MQCQVNVGEGEVIPFTDGRESHSEVPKKGLGPNYKKNRN